MTGDFCALLTGKGKNQRRSSHTDLTRGMVDVFQNTGIFDQIRGASDFVN